MDDLIRMMSPREATPQVDGVLEGNVVRNVKEKKDISIKASESGSENNHDSVSSGEFDD